MEVLLELLLAELLALLVRFAFARVLAWVHGAWSNRTQFALSSAAA